MAKTTLFQFNRGKANRLPNDVASSQSVKDVNILQEQDHRIAVPASNVCDGVFAVESVDLGERIQPVAEAREDF